MGDPLKFGLKIGADTKDAENNVARFEREFQKLLASLGKTPEEIRAFHALRVAAEAGEQSLKGVDQETLKLIRSFRQMGEVAKARDLLEVVPHEEINRRIASVTQAFETLKRSGTLSAKELAQANLAARDRIRELEQSTNGWSQSLGKIKGELAVAAAGLYGLGRAIGEASKESAAFSTAMAEVSTLVDDTAGMADLSQAARDLGKEFGSLPVEQAKALYQIISAGASDSAEAIEVLTAANKLAVGGVTDVKTAADGLTSILNAYGAEAGSATDVSDALFVAMKAGKTTVGELSASIGQVAPIAAQAGAGLDELLAATAALTKGGVSTSSAVTQLRGIVSSILKPTEEAKELARGLGLQFDAAALKTKGLAGFLEEVGRKTGGSADKMSVLFGQVEALGGALTLTGKGAGDFGQILDNMGKKAGETEKAFGKMADTPEMAAKKFQSAMSDLKISVGDAVNSLHPLLSGLTGVVNAFNALPGPVKTSAAGLGTLAAAAAVVGPALYRIVPIAQAMAVSLSGGSEASKALAAALPGLAAKAGALAATFSLAVTAGYAFRDMLDYVAGAGQADRDALYEARDAAYQRIAALKDQISELEEYQKTSRLTADQVALLSAEERDQYAKRLGHLQELQEAELRVARLEEGLGKSTKARQEQLRGELAATGEAFTALEAGARFAAEAMARGVSPEAAQLGLELQKLVGQGKSAAEAVQALGKPLDPGSVESVRRLGQGIQEAERLGVLSAEGVRQAWAAALEKLSIEDLDRFAVAAKAAFGDVEGAADTLAGAVEGGVAAALKKLGVDAREVTTGISKEAREAATAFELVARDIGGVAGSAKDAAKILEASFAAALKKATSTEDLEALRRSVQRVGNEGGPAATILAKALDAVDAKAKELAAQGAPEAAAAVGRLGEEAKQAAGALQETAAAAGDLGDQGEAGGRRAGRGLGVVRAEAVAARAQVEALGEEAVAAYEAALRASGRQLVSLGEIQRTAATVTLAYQDQARQVEALTARLGAQEGATRENIAAAEEALGTFRLLGEERLGPLRQALEDARRRTQALQDDARSTLGSLRDELDQMNRDYAAVERRRYETRRADLEAKLQEAQAARDRQAEKDLRESLRVLDQIHQKKMADIQAERKAEAERAREAADAGRREAAGGARAGAEQALPPASARADGALAREAASRTRTGEFAPTVTRVVRVEGANGASALVGEDQVDGLLAILEQQGLRAI